MNENDNIQFPLCEATGAPICSKMEESRLEQELTIDQKVELKLKAGIAPTAQEEMYCTLPYDLPGEKWIPIEECGGKFLISNKRRVKSSDGCSMKVRRGGETRIYLSTVMKHLNATEYVVDHFPKNDIHTDDELINKYLKYKENENMVIYKLNNNIKLTSKDITYCTLIQDLPKEKWRPVVGMEDAYAVSNLGRVKSIIRNEIVSISLNTGGYPLANTYYKGKHASLKVHRLVALAWIPLTEEDKAKGRDQINHLDGDHLNNCVENLQWCTQAENNRHAAVNELGNRTKITHDILAEGVAFLQEHPEMSIKAMTDLPQFAGVATYRAWYQLLTRKRRKWYTDIPIINRDCEFFKDDDMIVEVFVRYAHGEGGPSISRRFNVNSSTIYRILRGQSHKDFHIEDHMDLYNEIENRLYPDS